MGITYGTKQQVSFSDLNEYYYALGFLANSKNAKLHWENNEEQGAWGSEGRIHCLIPEKNFPQFFKFTAGRGAIYARINCNEYVEKLIMEHNFSYNGKAQNIEAILETVPEKYRKIFSDGYGGNINCYPEYKEKRVNRTPKRTSSTRSSASSINIIGGKPEKEKPPAPPKVDLIVYDRVRHKSFGDGTVVEISGDYFLVEFKDKTTKFSNPMSFIKGFIKKI